MGLNCPYCGKSTNWEGNEWRPFCSKPCKVIDLGAWISGDYIIHDRTQAGENTKKEIEIEEEQ